MRLALLGADRATLAIAKATIADRRYQLVAVCECEAGPFSSELASLALAVPEFANWESLLDANLVDAVVVGHSPDEDRRTEQLRKFAQVAIPVLASHPLFAAMIVYYELDMIRRDTQGVMLPYLPERLHPAIVEMQRMFAGRSDGPIGRVEQMVFERHLLDRGKPAVTAQFAHDVDLLRAIGGEISRIGALGGNDESQSYNTLSLQMSGPSGVPSRWSVAPAEEHDWGRLMLLGSAGRAIVTMPADAAPWSFELSVAGSRMERKLDQHWNPAEVALDQLARAVRGAAVKPDWVDAARSAELTETIDRSLKKGRTIELHYEEYSEESTFKGIMAALGCGVLILGLMFLVLIAVVEDFGRAVGRRIPLVAHWPYLLLGLMVIFLLLQLLLLAMRRHGPADRGQSAGAASGPATPDDAGPDDTGSGK
jgi:predicted dehydrogenase